MTAPSGARNTPQTRHAARVSAARAVVKISEKLGRDVDPDIARLARLPRDLAKVDRESEHSGSPPAPSTP